MKISLLILPLIALSLTGCDPVPSDTSMDYGDLLSIEVADGLEDEYVIYTIVDLDEVLVTANYANGSTTIEGSELTFEPEELDTSEIGDYEITISYETKSVVWTYSVVEYDVIDSVSAPQFVVDYQANIATKTSKENEFMDREQGFVVGDDNIFKFFPRISAYDSDGVFMNVTAYHSVSIIKEKRGAEWVTLSGTELEAIVAIDDFASTYDFTEQAIGKEFQLTVRPYGEKYATAAKYSTSFQFRVEDGYNVYTQDDLVHFNNIADPTESERSWELNRWDAYRIANDITPLDVNGFFFQNDIDIEREKLPDGFFYMEGDSDIDLTNDADRDFIIGSLRDNVDIYHRDIASDEDFVFNGNYFNLDYSSLPYVVRVGDPQSELGNIISHATFIKAGVSEVRTEVGNFSMKNLSVVGNANRSEEDAKTGGTIFLKVLSAEGHIYNTIMTQCYTTILSEYYSPKIVIEKVRGYDSFSSLLYNWGTDDFLIKDSEFKGAGGPVIITDHVYGTDGVGGYQPHTRVENSVLEAYVTGFESWFSLVGANAEAVPGIIDLGQMLSLYGTNSITIPSYLGVNQFHFNLVAIVKEGSVKSISTEKINGTFLIDDGVALDFAGPFMSAVSSLNPAMPRFQSTDGQVALYTGSALLDNQFQPIDYYANTNENYFTGDYMNLYYNSGYGDGHMGIVFGLLDQSTT